MMENLMIKQFKEWFELFINETDSEKKEQWHQRIIGFIIGLELSGKNIEANQCKDMFENIKSR